MKVIETSIPDVKIIEPRVFGDQRGFFLETYHSQRYLEQAGIPGMFVQDNYSRSAKGVLRGLHFQRCHPQGKLVRVTQGAVYDVAVDIRPNSPTFQRWVGLELSAENFKQLWIPPGFAHGFVTLSEFAGFEYKCTEYYDPNDEACLLWNDPELGIQWPIENPLLSEKDRKGVSLGALDL